MFLMFGRFFHLWNKVHSSKSQTICGMRMEISNNENSTWSIFINWGPKWRHFAQHCNWNEWKRKEILILFCFCVVFFCSSLNLVGCRSHADDSIPSNIEATLCEDPFCADIKMYRSSSNNNSRQTDRWESHKNWRKTWKGKSYPRTVLCLSCASARRLSHNFIHRMLLLLLLILSLLLFFSLFYYFFIVCFLRSFSAVWLMLEFRDFCVNKKTNCTFSIKWKKIL